MLTWIFLAMATLTVVTATDTCYKIVEVNDTKLPDDELMNAFFIADVEKQTGYIRFQEDPERRDLNGMAGRFVSSTIRYNTWFYKGHSGRQRFQHLWAYISWLVASDVRELFGHYNSLPQPASQKPRARIDFDKLKTTFADACSNYAKYNSTWPFSCYPSSFFCSFSEALTEMKKILYYTKTDEIKHMKCSLGNPRPLFVINEMSDIIVDNPERSTTLKKLFSPNIVRNFTEDILLRPLYRSGLVRGVMYVLVTEPTGYYNKILSEKLEFLKKTILDGCSENANTQLGTAYYCRAKDLLLRTNECVAVKNKTCAYAPMYQMYFETGLFYYRSEFVALDALTNVTGSIARTLGDALVANNTLVLIEHVRYFSTLINLTSSQCSHEWPKAFEIVNYLELKIKTQYRPDCTVNFLTDAVKKFRRIKGYSPWTEPKTREAKYMFVFLLAYPPYFFDYNIPDRESDAAIMSVHRKVDEYRSRFNVTGFEVLWKDLPSHIFYSTWVKRFACMRDPMPHKFKNFCLISALTDCIKQFTESIRNSQNQKVRILNPSIDYKRLLEQLQLSRISAYLNKQAQTYFQILSNKISEIPVYLEQNFNAIGTYFSALADYDTKKATADVAYIRSALNQYQNRLNPKTNELSRNLGKLFAMAVGTAAADVAIRATQFALEIALNCNPLKHLFGGSDPNAVADRLNDLMVSIAGLTRAAVVGTKYIPEIGRRSQALSDGFRKNSRFINRVRRLIDNLNKDSEDIEDTVKVFLGEYNDYSPAVTADMIESFGVYMETVIDELCDVAFSTGTTGGAAGQIAIASSGECVLMKPLLAEVISISTEIYSFQFEMMETLATACRAKYAASFANKMKIEFSSNVKFDMSFLKNNAIISFMVSELHIWGQVSQYCDVLTYTGGGVEPVVCKQAMAFPNENNVGRLISHVQDDPCNVGSRTRPTLRIPTAKTGESNSYLDLKKLFSGEEVTFQVPNPQWLQGKGLISSEELNKAIYIEQMKIMLPTELSGAKMVQVTALPSQGNVLKKGEDVKQRSYVFQSSRFETRYTVNMPNCHTTASRLPYDYCHTLQTVCVHKDGKKVRKVQPSIYNKFRLRMTDPGSLPAPNDKTNLTIVAVLTLCSKSGSRKRAVPTQLDSSNPRYFSKRQQNSQFCCKDNKYLTNNGCQECPAGSTRKLSGHYCG